MDITNLKLNNFEQDDLRCALTGLSKEEMLENERVYEESQKYKKLAREKWPNFELLWDTNKEKHRFALDSFTEEDFNRDFPDGLLVGWVNYQEMYSKLSERYQHPIENIWSMCSHDKVAKNILYWVEKKAMTPPLISLFRGDLNIAGGCGRMAICAVKRPLKIPILIKPSEEEAIRGKLLTLSIE